MEKLKGLKQFQIAKKELKLVMGGLDPDPKVVEYCRTLDLIVRHNTLSKESLLAARLAAAEHCEGIL
ncbi:hypothetical protein [Spongiimicrobium salis]|uniref:hypothetical protein n=1 Tax=Spongiimicrobium salis TaxID=1667022 RepID=UPI00374DF43E